MHDFSIEPVTAPMWSRFFSAASFDRPRLVTSSAWITHGPFGLWIVGAQQPRRIVELGVHTGLSYFVFCQSVRTHKISAACFAIDEWRGDEHAGFYGEEVFARVEAHNEANYADFSRLVRARFADAVSLFEDGSIDLIHIDGRHYYDDVRSDFETWLPKLSGRGVVLFHDTQERGRDFGVHRLWNELREIYPGFEFHHGHGLGVLGVGANQAPALQALFAVDREEATRDLVRLGYAKLGAAIEDNRRVALAQGDSEKRRHAEAELARTVSQASALRAAIDACLAADAGARSLAVSVPRLDSSLSGVAKRLEKASRRLVRLTLPGEGKGSGSLLFRPPAVKRRRGKRAKAVGPRPNSSVPPLPAPPLPAVAKPPLTPIEGFVAAAIAVVWEEGWLASKPLWTAIYEQRISVSRPNLYEIQTSPTNDFEEVTPQPIRSETLRWCVYTTLFGDYDDLRTPVDLPPGIDFICFTDREAEVDGWRMIRVDAIDGPIRDSRRYKLLPHQVLAEYDASLYVDASTLLTGDIGRFVRRWCIGRPMVMWRHAQRCDVYDEAIAVLAQSKADPELVIRQITHYEAAGLPRSSGLVEAPFMWRVHRHGSTRQLMEAWHREVTAHSARDQISLGFLMWRTGIRPQVFPSRLGNVRHNCISSIVPHHAKVAKRNLSIPRSRAPTAQAKRRVVFIYSDAYRSSGSTTMRGFQLAEIMRTHLGERYEVDVTADMNVQDSIVILTKGRLHGINEYDMQKLSRNNIATVADFVDDPTRPSLLEFVDLLWAASIRALRTALFARPMIDVDLVTHHVDPRIPRQGPVPHFAAGYFGETVNAVLSPEIERSVTVVKVNTKLDDGDWLRELGRFSLHYAVRPSIRASTHKPFLKGFTAARCCANILVDRNDGDAINYLGDDYPYLLADNQPATILAGIEFARQSFGSPEWRDALEVMRHIETLCTPEHVALEVRRSLRRFD